METWYISISFKANSPFSEDFAFDISEHLQDFAAVMSMARDMNSGSVALTIDANDWNTALKRGHAAVMDTLRAASIEATTTSIGVQNQEEFDAALNEPVYPQVVGFAEIARLAGVSRQRARQLAEKATFPYPVIKTRQGPLYNIHAVQRWLETRAMERPSAQVTTA